MLNYHIYEYNTKLKIFYKTLDSIGVRMGQNTPIVEYKKFLEKNWTIVSLWKEIFLYWSRVNPL